MNLINRLSSIMLVFGLSLTAYTQTKVFCNTGTLKTYSGIFISEVTKIFFAITRVSNRIYAKLGNIPSFEIYPKANHQFFGKKIDIEFTFEINNNLVTGLPAERIDQLFHFKKEAK